MSDNDPFLPDFCRIQAVLILLIITELAAILYVFVASPWQAFDWNRLALVSLFLQWLVLTSAALLCLLRRTGSEFSQVRMALLGLAAVVVNTGVFSLFAGWLQSLFVALEPFRPDTPFIVKTMLVSALITALAFRYFYLEHASRRQKQAELRARLQALQSRIRPHFLFNSMNTIANLISVAPRQAEELVLNLADLFRASLDETRVLIPLAKELDLCRGYLAIEQQRLGPRLQVEWDMEAPLPKADLPQLSLQPLVENAIYHGIQPNPDGGTLTIRLRSSTHKVKLTLRNSLYHGPKPKRIEGNHMALANTRDRLQACFGEQARLDCYQEKDGYTAIMEFPTLRGAGS